jgi:hypothetical protein
MPSVFHKLIFLLGIGMARLTLLNGYTFSKLSIDPSPRPAQLFGRESDATLAFRFKSISIAARNTQNRRFNASSAKSF